MLASCGSLDWAMLVLETNFYTNKQFKAFKTLEAFNHNGFGICNLSCMQSNRWQVCRESLCYLCSAFPAYGYMILLVTIWVISEKDRTILSADCFGHKAGLAESCSHIACVILFRGNYTNSSWQARLHTGKMLMDFSNICMQELTTSSFHRLRNSKKSSTKKLRITTAESL